MAKYDKLSNEVFDRILEERVARLSAAQILQVPGVYEIFSEYFNNTILEQWENTLEYVHVNIIPTYRDDVGWKADMSGVLPSYIDEDDAINDLRDNYIYALELGKDELPADVVNIWHDIEGQNKPDRVFACQEDFGGSWIYIGITLRSDTY